MLARNRHFVLLLVAAWGGLSLTSLCAQSIIIEAAELHSVEGPALMGGAQLVIRNGLIEKLGAKAKGENGKASHNGTKVHHFEHGVIVPGFVDAASYAGVRSQRNETTEAVLPWLSIADAIEGEESSLAANDAAAITTCQVMPGDLNVIGGTTAVIKRRGTMSFKILNDNALLKASLAAAAYAPQRAPTHLLGGVELLRQHADQPGVANYIAKPGGLLIAVQQAHEVDAALNLAKSWKCRPILLGNASAFRSHVKRLKDQCAGVVLNPMAPDASQHDLKVPSQLAAGKIPFAYCTRSPARPTNVLRLSAVMSRMGGLDAKTALHALTLAPARLLGVADQVGSLKVGKAGDCAVFDRNPTDARARLLLVVRDGRVVFEASGESK